MNFYLDILFYNQLYKLKKMKQKYIKLIPFLLLYVFVFEANAQCDFSVNTPIDTVFVKEQGSGLGEGLSWDNSLDGRLLAKYIKEKAQDSTVIYVARGIYYPYNPACDSPANIREYSFSIGKAIRLLGGYPDTNTGTDILTRDIKQYETRLSGNIDNPNDGDVTNNAFHVVVIEKDVMPTIDGFYISDGYANSNDVTDASNGGGILDYGGANTTVVLSNLIIENNYANYGGGVYFYDNQATVLQNSILRNNTTLIGFGGSAIFAWGNFGLLSSEVSENKNGRAVVSWGGDLSIRNSTISNNSAQGIYISPQGTRQVKMRIIGSTIANNHGVGFYAENPSVSNPSQLSVNIDNSLFVNNNNDATNAPVNNVNLNGNHPVEIINLKYSVIGNTMYQQNGISPTTLSVLVSLGNLEENNNGFTRTQALLGVCNNPAVNAGDPDLFIDDPLNLYDQNGVERNYPLPCIGAYDGVSTTDCTPTDAKSTQRDNSIHAYKKDGFIFVSGLDENIQSNIEIFDIRGYLLKSYSTSDSLINIKLPSEGISLILKISGGGRQFIFKF